MDAVLDVSVRKLLALHWLVIMHNVTLVLGLDQPMYSLIENNTVHMLRLKLLSSTRSHGFDRPRLRLKSIPGTATGELKHTLECKYLIVEPERAPH